MRFNVITIFPELISQYGEESILGRAQANRLLTISPVCLRDFSNDDQHNKIDDTPYGGGAGMVMKPEPIYNALRSLDAIPFAKADGLIKVKKIFAGDLEKKKRTILLSPRGRQFNQRLAEEWSQFSELTLVCGRYEGVDQRVADHMVDEEISIGPYVLAGGELGALVIIEALARLLPGVLGNPESLREETFAARAHADANCKNDVGHASDPSHTSDCNQASDHSYTAHEIIEVEYPQYTKPANFKGWKVPEILLSGDHGKIAAWRRTTGR